MGSVLDFARGVSRRPKEAWKVALHRVKRLSDVTLAETPARFWVSRDGGVPWATHRVQTAAQADTAMRRRLHRIERKLNQPKT